ncbi:MAG: Calx-beta domain-containing protein [bacterium]
MKIVHTSLSLFCGLMLTACGGGGSDSNNPSSASLLSFSTTNATSKELNTTPFERDVNHTNHFQLEISKALTVDATVDYYTVDGTAIAGEDYIATSGTVTIPAGETTVLIGVEIIGDNIVENNETFSLVVHNPINGEFANGVAELRAEHTIVNDDSNSTVDNTLETATNILKIMLEGIRPIMSVENLTTIPEDRLGDAFAQDKNNETLDCTQSGQFTYTFTDNNTDKAYSTVGDQFSLNANQCNDNATTSHGNYSLSITADNTITGTQEIRTTQVTLNNFMLTDSNGSYTFNGVLTLNSNRIFSNSNKEIQVNSTQLSLVGNNNSDFSNLAAIKSINEDTNEQSINTYNASLTLSNSSYNGGYQVSVPSPLKITNFEQYPYAGQFKVQRTSDNLIAYATAIDANTVRITADRNGDGSVEYSQDLPWTSMSSGLK